MRRKLSAVILLMLMVALCQEVSAQSAQPKPEAFATKVTRLLDEMGDSYTKVKDGVWSVPFNGKAMPDFNVVISGQSDLVVVFALLAEKKDLKVTPEMMRIMLRLNNDIDRVKVLIDDDGDALIRIDLSLRTLDSKALKDNINQVAYATDEAYKALKQFITTPK